MYPFTLKLVEIAKGDTALATAIVFLLMIVTVVIIPLALSLMLEDDISVDSLRIQVSGAYDDHHFKDNT